MRSRPYESLIIVGPSGSGKTTLVNSLRKPEFEESVVIPKRYITRRQRIGDDLTENAPTTHDKFEAGVRSGMITPHWSRRLGSDKEERYGFRVLEDDEERLPVYSANDAFLASEEIDAKRIVSSGLVVVVFADKEQRATRLERRAMDISTIEMNVRLNNTPFDGLYGHDHALEIIDTTAKSILMSTQELHDMVDAFAN